MTVHKIPGLRGTLQTASTDATQLWKLQHYTRFRTGSGRQPPPG
ncbi:hypothetical protein ACNKHU_08665 [Shigella flexneri]